MHPGWNGEQEGGWVGKHTLAGWVCLCGVGDGFLGSHSLVFSPPEQLWLLSSLPRDLGTAASL